jgi:tRNA nucleotidyltransferase (CCA-adding enzyme)
MDRIERQKETVRRMAIERPEWHFYFVGGTVRDAVLDERSKDIDVIVFGDYTEQALIDVCKRFGKVTRDAGKSFQAIKLFDGKGMPIDVLQPRIDIKVGAGHKGFETIRKPTISLRDESERRDYTFGALYQDVLTGEIYDFHDGVRDLEARRLAHVSDETYMDDPLRVLRGMQFCARFDMIAERATIEQCRAHVDAFSELPVERVWDEFYKLFKARKPSRGLVFLNRSGWIKHFPELARLRRLAQEDRHHPEGTVWVHTKMVADEAAKIARREGLSVDDTIVLVASAILHDIGKADTTEVIDGKIVTYRHAELGAAQAVEFLTRLGAPADVIDKVSELVREHMFIVGEFGERAVRRLSSRLQKTSIRLLSLLMEADVCGRKERVPLKRAERVAYIRELVEMAQSLDAIDGAPAPILMGRHLIEMGYKPGVLFGRVLRAVYDLQMDGKIQTIEEASRAAIIIASADAVAYGTSHTQ